MPTPIKGARLGGSAAHQRIILANLASQLFEHDRIVTTEARARLLRPLAEKLITKAKRGDLHARRLVLTTVRDKGVVHKLFTEIAPTFAEREGGYTRITKVGPRKGDNAPMAMIELVTESVEDSKKANASRPAQATRPATARPGGTAAAAAAAPAAAAASSAPEAAVTATAADTAAEEALAEESVEETATEETAAEETAAEESVEESPAVVPVAQLAEAESGAEPAADETAEEAPAEELVSATEQLDGATETEAAPSDDTSAEEAADNSKA